MWINNIDLSFLYCTEKEYCKDIFISTGVGVIFQERANINFMEH